MKLIIQYTIEHIIYCIPFDTIYQTIDHTVNNIHCVIDYTNTIQYIKQ